MENEKRGKRGWWIGALAVTLVWACGSSDDAPATDGGARDGGSRGDGGSNAAWTWCPSSDAYVGDDTWSQSLYQSDALWCLSGTEEETLESVRDRKMRLQFIAGDYKIPPRVDAGGEIVLPLCLERGNEAGPAVSSGSFQVQLFDNVESTLQIQLDLDETGSIDVAGSFLNGMLGEGEWPTLSLDSENGGNSFDGLAVTYDRAFFAPCELPVGRAQERLFDFENGDSLRFSFNAIAGSVTTGPSGGHQVTGTVDGQAIDIVDYYQILYTPSHHHIDGGVFAILFDEPLRDACGIRVDNASETPNAALIDCDLQDIESLTLVDSE